MQQHSAFEIIGRKKCGIWLWWLRSWIFRTIFYEHLFKDIKFEIFFCVNYFIYFSCWIMSFGCCLECSNVDLTMPNNVTDGTNFVPCKCCYIITWACSQCEKGLFVGLYEWLRFFIIWYSVLILKVQIISRWMLSYNFRWLWVLKWSSMLNTNYRSACI